MTYVSKNKKNYCKQFLRKIYLILLLQIWK